jgi:hypothetical protein
MLPDTSLESDGNFIYISSVYVWLGNRAKLSVSLHLAWNCSMTLQSSGPWPLFQFLNQYTVSRTPFTGEQPSARPLSTHRINAHRHLYFQWDSNSRSQCSSRRRRFMTYTAGHCDRRLQKTTLKIQESKNLTSASLSSLLKAH